jgi:hypothetical protein
VIKENDYLGARNVDTSGVIFLYEESDAHVCLLSDRNVKKLLDNVMNVLIKQGFAVTAHTYASSHQGRIDDLVYCFAPELTVFLDKHLISAGKFAVGPLFDKNLEEKHRIYHLLSNGTDSGKNYLDKATLDQLRVIQGTLGVDLKRTFDILGSLKAVEEDPTRVSIKNTEVFQKVIREAFLSPLVDYLLSRLTGNNKIIAGSPNPTKLIGAPQVNLLFGEMKYGGVQESSDGER